MQFIIKNGSGRHVATTHDREYAKRYAKQIGGTAQIVRNPKAEFGETPGLKKDRIKPFDDYAGDPSWIWTRETIQNSVDNNATEVKISVIAINSGPYVGCRLVRIADNGTGMNLKTLQEKFLTMGGTGKGERGEETGTMGGFGEAKKVVLLAWQAWRVITKTKSAAKAICADAVNGWKSYEFDEIDTPNSISTSGTIVEILTWTDIHVNIADSIAFISWCDLPKVRFTILKGDFIRGSILTGKFKYDPNREDCINKASISGRITTSGQEEIHVSEIRKDAIGHFALGRAKEVFYAPVEVNYADGRNVIETKECAKLYFERFPKSERAGKTSRIFYRVKGLFLWQSYPTFKVHGNIIIDFTIKTTMILSSNRDSIRNRILRERIEAWITLLTEDPRSLLRGYSKTQTMVFSGGEGSKASLRAPTKPTAIAAAQRIADIQYTTSGDRKKADKEIAIIADEATDKIIRIADSIPTESPIRIIPEITNKIIRYEAKASLEDNGSTDLVKAIERAMFIPEYVIHIEDDLAEEGFKIPEKFQPAKLTIELKKILAVYAEMIRLTFMMKNSTMSYAVGFVFSEDLVGLFMPRGFFPKNEQGTGGLDADGAILINPYLFDRSDRKILADVSNPQHIEKMWSICVHECTHMIDRVSQHDEAFAYYLTDNVGVVARVYPLVEAISEIVQTTEPLARAKFTADLDVDEYLSRDKKKGVKSRTARERKLEKFAVEIASQLAATGKGAPRPSDYGIDIQPSLWESVDAAAKLATDKTSFSSLTSDLLIKKLRRELAESHEKSKLLEEEKLHYEAPAPVQQVQSRQITGKLFKKYNS